MANSFVQVPPQSTGRKLSTEARTQMDYDNLIGDLFRVTDVVTGATSGATGTVTGIVTNDATTGYIFLRDVTGSFSNNEDLEVSATPVASVNGTTFQSLDVQKVILADPDNPSRMQTLDRFGATLNTFSDGAPIFGSFGLMQIGQPQIVKNYRFAYDAEDSKFWDQETSGATISYVSDSSVVLFSTPTTSGALASRTSDFYHPYVPGAGTHIEISCGIGDNGKTNVRRRWGLFDDLNGVYFQLDGTNLGIGLRSNTDGTATDTVVLQSDFNRDRVDGTGSLAFSIDLSKGNIFWIDFQWLGTGRVRYGVFEPGGSRITLHEIENTSLNVDVPYMRTATLPLRIEQENTGTAASTSEFRWNCATVKHSQKVSITSGGDVARLHSITTGSTLISLDGTNEIPIIAVRAKQTFKGLPNRGIVRIRSASFYNEGPNAAIFRIGGTLDSLMIGESFASHGAESITEVDTSATSATISAPYRSRIIAPGQSLTIDVQSDNSIHEFEMFLGADGAVQPVMVYTAESIGGTAEVALCVNWEEILQ
jgi:hypothetical protein